MHWWVVPSTGGSPWNQIWLYKPSWLMSKLTNYRKTQKKLKFFCIIRPRHCEKKEDKNILCIDLTDNRTFVFCSTFFFLYFRRPFFRRQRPIKHRHRFLPDNVVTIWDQHCLAVRAAGWCSFYTTSRCCSAVVGQTLYCWQKTKTPRSNSHCLGSKTEFLETVFRKQCVIN